LFFQNSIAEIAKLLQEFFRDLDVVPSDVFAGIVLLRRHQKIGMRHVVAQVRIVAKTSEDWYATCCSTGKNCCEDIRRLV
jgi:hypothetical protein